MRNEKLFCSVTKKFPAEQSTGFCVDDITVVFFVDLNADEMSDVFAVTNAATLKGIRLLAVAGDLILAVAVALSAKCVGLCVGRIRSGNDKRADQNQCRKKFFHGEALLCE